MFEAGTGSVGLFWLAQQPVLSRLTALEVGADVLLCDALQDMGVSENRDPNLGP